MRNTGRGFRYVVYLLKHLIILTQNLVFSTNTVQTKKGKSFSIAGFQLLNLENSPLYKVQNSLQGVNGKSNSTENR